MRRCAVAKAMKGPGRVATASFALTRGETRAEARAVHLCSRSHVPACRVCCSLSCITCQTAGSYLAILPRVCHQQGLPWLYGDVKSRSLFPVYQTQEMGGLRAARADRYPPLSSLFVTSVWTRAWIWDPRYQTACMQAGVYGGLTGCVAYRGVHLNSPSCSAESYILSSTGRPPGQCCPQRQIFQVPCAPHVCHTCMHKCPLVWPLGYIYLLACYLLALPSTHCCSTLSGLGWYVCSCAKATPAITCTHPVDL